MTAADDGATLAEELARVRRVAVRTGLQDLLGHVSARLADGRVLVTPGPGRHARPLRLRATDVVTTDLDGAIAGGPGEAGEAAAGDGPSLPPGYELDLAIYRARPDVGSIAWASPPGAIAFGLVGRDLAAIPISFAEFAHAGAAFVQPDRLQLSRADGEAWAAAVGGRGFLHVQGVATVTLAPSPRAALWATYGLENLAAMSRIALGLSAEPRAMTRQDVGRVFGAMPSERRPSRDPLAYLPSLDRRPGPLPSERWPADDEVGAIRRRVAVACRILAANGSLVTFLEHVSHRVPGRDDAFAMSPSKDFAAMLPGDVGLVSTAGDCPPIDGPYAPAPFRWFHRDLLAARPDVGAIVHTHELFGRAFAAAGRRPAPVWRNGALEVVDPPPVFETASLVFSAEDRAAVLGLLGSGRTVHELYHGTDFAAPTIEEATVAAVHREACLAMEASALQLGEPAVLGAPFLADLRSTGPSAGAWWAAYEDALSLADPC